MSVVEDNRVEYWLGYERGYREAQRDAERDELGVSLSFAQPFIREAKNVDRGVNVNNSANPERDSNGCMVYRGVKR